MHSQSITKWLNESLEGDTTVILGNEHKPVHTSSVLTSAKRLGIKVSTQKCYVVLPDRYKPVTLNALHVTIIEGVNHGL